MAADNSITLMAPSKTFNIAGIVSSFAVITNKTIRQRYLAYLQPRELHQGTLFAYTATRVAYDECEDWLDQMIRYVQGNVNFVISYLSEFIPQIKVIKPEASFLVWLDCRSLQLPQHELVKLLLTKHSWR